MRITSQMMMSQYKSNVNDALSSMNKAMQTAYDYRSFELPSDNPLAAAQTFQVHWETSLNQNYQTNVSNLKSSINTADGILQNVDGILTTIYGSELGGVTASTNQSGREAAARQILAYRDTLLSEMNSKYSDSYLFGGSNSSDVPFTVSGGQLYYRGINVDTGENLNGASETLTYNYTDSTDPAHPVTTQKTMQVNFGKDIGAELNNYKLEIDAGGSEFSTTVTPSGTGTGGTIAVTVPAGTKKGDLQSYLEGTYAGPAAVGSAFSSSLTAIDSTLTADQAAAMAKGVTISGLPDNAGDTVLDSAASAAITDKADLDKLANESIYVDIGLGISQDASGAVKGQSAFDSSMPGIAYLGYGTSDVAADDGSTTTVPNNIYSLLTDIAGYLNDGTLSGTELMSKVDPYMTNLTSAQEKLEAKQTEVGTSVQMLNDTDSYLQNIATNLDDRDNQVEYVDFTDAITDYSMQEYCYEASLQVGSQIIQKSLMDYLT